MLIRYIEIFYSTNIHTPAAAPYRLSHSSDDGCDTQVYYEPQLSKLCTVSDVTCIWSIVCAHLPVVHKLQGDCTG